MSLFTFALCIHVVTAVVGLGQVVAVAVLASSGRDAAPFPTVALSALRRLLVGTALSLALVLLSGVLVEYASGGLFHRSWWFRLSFFQVLLLGAINGSSLRALRRADQAALPATLRRVSAAAWVMSVLIAEITVLMEVKPW